MERELSGIESVALVNCRINDCIACADNGNLARLCIYGCNGFIAARPFNIGNFICIEGSELELLGDCNI